MSFDPYLHFQGNCRAALQDYARIFNGRLELMPYSEAPDPSPEMAASDLVMHGLLHVGERMLMASDFPPGEGGDPQSAVSISHTAPDATEALRIFAALSEGGIVIMPFEKTFWADGFGMLKDRHGTHWMVSGPALG